MVIKTGVKRWWKHVLCFFHVGCQWHHKIVRTGESSERMCTVPGCHRRQMMTVHGWWANVKRDRRRKSGKGYMRQVK